MAVILTGRILIWFSLLVRSGYFTLKVGTGSSSPESANLPYVLIAGRIISVQQVGIEHVTVRLVIAVLVVKDLGGLHPGLGREP